MLWEIEIILANKGFLKKLALNNMLISKYWKINQGKSIENA